MSLKKNKEFGNYMDQVNVKIAEEYKPPPKINRLMTHNQRLAFNAQIEENLPKYDFSIEESILERVKQWRENRVVSEEQRKMKLQTLKDDESETEIENSENSSDSKGNHKTYETGSVETSIGTAYTSPQQKGILLPTKISNNSNIKAIGTNSMNHNDLNGKSPFNISEFEADTSSPFDNVALKSINDVEELAKVLKIEDLTTQPSTVSHCNFPDPQHTQNISNYLNTSNISYNIQSSLGGVDSYFNRSDMQYSQSYGSNYQFSPASNDYRSCNSKQFENKEDFATKPPNVQKMPSGKMNERARSSIDLCDPFDDLPEHLQDLSRDISSMGFPLPRVARTCKLVGDDNKKILDHLLAMSELLDLGFSEDKISKALLSCENDRDKALEQLIS